MTYYDKIQESVTYIRSISNTTPECAIVLGTGLGNFTDNISINHRIPYEDIPHFPPVTVKGHAGELIIGHVNNIPVIAQSGRYHYYEGYDMKEVTFPIRVFKYLGARILLIASATGGIHEDYQAGDVTIVNDHINLHHQNPLQGHNDDRLGPRFPDMMEAYDDALIKKCHSIAKKNNITLYNSIYGGLPGPNLETKSEYRMLHILGATVVGMSTVPEIIVAKHMNMKSCVLTAVTNKCWPIEAIGETTHEDVIIEAAKAENKISTIALELISQIGN